MLLVFLGFVALVSNTLGATVRYDNHEVIVARPTTLQHLHVLKNLHENRNLKLNFWDEPNRLGAVELSAAPGSSSIAKQVLVDNGISFTVPVTNLQMVMDNVDAARKASRERADPTNFILSDYQTHATINQWLDQLAVNYSMATVRSIGRSYEGRDMRAITISSGSGRRANVLDCGIHAREWITVSTCVYTIQRLLTTYETDANVRAMIDNYDWHILPVVNPDGYQYTHDTDRFWRKSRGDTTDPLCVGTDLNRNFDAFWGSAGVSWDECSDTYPGTGEFSEEETAAVRDWVNGIQNKIFYLNIHSKGQMWLVPWGYNPLENYPEDYDELLRVADLAMASLQAVNGLDFIVGTPPDILYEVAGGALDWAKLNGVKYSYSPELYPIECDPIGCGWVLPPEDIVPRGAEVFAALYTHCQEMQ